MSAPVAEAAIRSEPRPGCHVCGGAGAELYTNLRDRLFDAPGTWRLVRCAGRACGLVWLDPMPLASDIATAYARYLTHDPPPARAMDGRARLLRAGRRGYLALRFGAYRGQVPAWQKALGLAMLLRPLRREEVDATLMHLGVIPGGRLLDLGCGRGDHLEALGGAGWQAEGMDADADAVTVVRARGLRASAARVEDAHLPADAFDAVTMSHTLEHLPDPAAALRAIRRALRPGGQVAILTPNLGSLGHRRFGAAWFALDPPRHLHLFTRAALSRLLGDVDLRVRILRTSARGAAEIIAGSRAIERDGRYRPGTVRRRPGPAAGWREWLALRRDAEAGEEIVAVAERPLGGS